MGNQSGRTIDEMSPEFRVRLRPKLSRLEEMFEDIEEFDIEQYWKLEGFIWGEIVRMEILKSGEVDDV